MTIKNIIEFNKVIRTTEKQNYDLLKYMFDNVHNFFHEATYFYCEILKNEYFNISYELSKIANGDDEHLKIFAKDLYDYCEANCVIK